MKYISQSVYEQLEEIYISEHFKIEKPVPNQMIGEYGWHAKKKREFKEFMMEHGYTING